MRSLRARVLLCGVLVAALGPATSASAEPARSADSFVDSVGVNVHMNYGDTVYRNHALLIDELAKAGIRHVRDGLSWNTESAYATFNQLADRGIGVTFIMGDPSERRDTLDQLLTALRTRVRRAADAVEGPNEYSSSGDPDWAAHLRAYQQRLYSAVKGDPTLSQLPVIGPSLITWQDYAALGDMRSALDFGNKHPYPGGDIPEANLDSELSTAARESGDRPIWATESGYHNALATTGGHRPASEAAAATYLPRMYLEYFRRGIARTFAYELIDLWPNPAMNDQESHFGLLRNDYSEKPAYGRIANLTSILSDRGPAFSAQPLDLTIASGPTDLHRLLLEKRDGSYYLVLWRAERVWDPATRQPVAAGAANVHVDLGSAAASGFQGAQLFDPAAGTTPRSTFASVQHFDVSVGPDPMIVKLVPGAPATMTPTPSTPPASTPPASKPPTTTTPPASNPHPVVPPPAKLPVPPRVTVRHHQRLRKVLHEGLLLRCWSPGSTACTAIAWRGHEVLGVGVHASGSAPLRVRLTAPGRRLVRRAMRRHRSMKLRLLAVAPGGRPAYRRVVVTP